MRYTYKKKQKFYQLNTITSLNIHSNKPNLRKYPSILALFFSKIYNFTNQRFPQQYIKNISRAVFDKQSQTIDRQVKIFEVPKLRNESSFQLSLRILSRVFREHVQRPLERILALELGPQIGTTKDERSFAAFIGAKDKRNDCGSVFSPDISRSTICDAKCQLLPAAILFSTNVVNSAFIFFVLTIEQVLLYINKI